MVGMQGSVYVVYNAVAPAQGVKWVALLLRFFVPRSAALLTYGHGSRWDGAARTFAAVAPLHFCVCTVRTIHLHACM